MLNALIATISLIAGSTPEQIVKQLSTEELAAQLLVVPVQGGADGGEFLTWLQSHPVGGLIFMGGDPEAQRLLAKQCQQQSPLPLLIAQDQEWGPAMRLPGTTQFPRAAVLGALTDLRLVEAAGRAMGQLALYYGVNWPLQPVADLLVDPSLSVIATRSFGADSERVSQHIVPLMKGLRGSGVLPCVKHFPGHGAANADSHLELPQLPDDAELCHDALIPFEAAIAHGVETLMVGHLDAPVWDPGRPASLSSRIMLDLLRDELGYEGLIVTDSLYMQAILAHWPLEQAAAEAICHGADMALFCGPTPSVNAQLRAQVDAVIKTICAMVPRSQLERSALRVLQAKQLAQMRCAKQPDIEEIQRLIQRLYTETVQVTHDRAGLLPASRVRLQQIGGSADCPFFRELKLSHTPRGPIFLLAIFPEPNLATERFGISEETEALVDQLGKQTLVVWFGPPWGATHLQSAGALITAYEPTDGAQRAAARLLNQLGN